jgi:hypothetical protein
VLVSIESFYRGYGTQVTLREYLFDYQFAESNMRALQGSICGE